MAVRISWRTPQRSASPTIDSGDSFVRQECEATPPRFPAAALARQIDRSVHCTRRKRGTGVGDTLKRGRTVVLDAEGFEGVGQAQKPDPDATSRERGHCQQHIVQESEDRLGRLGDGASVELADDPAQDAWA